MAAAILSQDIMAICLFLADWEVDLSLKEIILRAEEYQVIKNRHFGISRNDFRNLFYILLRLELGIVNYVEAINDIKLVDIISLILKYHDAHFNDEGEHWIKYLNVQHKEIDYQFITYWFSYNRAEYIEKEELKNRMSGFFGNQKSGFCQRGLIEKYKEELKITEAILHQYSRPGESS